MKSNKKENIVLDYEIAMNITKLILREDLDHINEEISRMMSINHSELEDYIELRWAIKTLLTRWYGETL